MSYIKNLITGVDMNREEEPCQRNEHDKKFLYPCHNKSTDIFANLSDLLHYFKTDSENILTISILDDCL